jgi:hypothetical protein
VFLASAKKVSKPPKGIEQNVLKQMNISLLLGEMSAGQRGLSHPRKGLNEIPIIGIQIIPVNTGNL